MNSSQVSSILAKNPSRSLTSAVVNACFSSAFLEPEAWHVSPCCSVILLQEPSSHSSSSPSSHSIGLRGKLPRKKDRLSDCGPLGSMVSVSCPRETPERAGEKLVQSLNGGLCPRGPGPLVGQPGLPRTEPRGKAKQSISVSKRKITHFKFTRTS